MRMLILLATIATGQTSATGAADRPRSVHCGGYCLYIALEALGAAPRSYEDLQARLKPPPPSGYSLDQLDEAARALGAKTLVVETTVDDLLGRSEPFACITLITKNHYVLLYDIDGKYAYFIDYPSKSKVPLDTFRAVWERKALLVGPEKFEGEESVFARLRRRRLARDVALGVAGAAVVGFAAACLWRFVRRRSRSAVAGGFLVLSWLGAGCGADSGTSAVPAPAALVLQPARHRLGTIKLTGPDETRSVATRLINRGGSPLRIRQIVRSCNCTEVTLDVNLIPPGGEAILTAVIRLGDSPEPRVSRLGIVTSSDDVASDEVLIEWQVRGSVRTEPSTLSPVELAPGAEARRTVAVHLDDLELCKKCSILARADEGLLKLTVRPTPGTTVVGHSSPGGRDVAAAELEVLIRPQTEERQYRETVELSVVCDGAVRGRFAMPVAWRVLPPILVSPARLVIGDARPAETFERHLVLRARDGAPFRLLRVACRDPKALLESRFSESESGVHALKMRFAAPPEPGPWRSLLDVRTDHPKSSLLYVPFSIVVGREDAARRAGGTSPSGSRRLR